MLASFSSGCRSYLKKDPDSWPPRDDVFSNKLFPLISSLIKLIFSGSSGVFFFRAWCVVVKGWDWGGKTWNCCCCCCCCGCCWTWNWICCCCGCCPLIWSWYWSWLSAVVWKKRWFSHGYLQSCCNLIYWLRTFFLIHILG